MACLLNLPAAKVCSIGGELALVISIYASTQFSVITRTRPKIDYFTAAFRSMGSNNKQKTRASNQETHKQVRPKKRKRASLNTSTVLHEICETLCQAWTIMPLDMTIYKWLELACIVRTDTICFIDSFHWCVGRAIVSRQRAYRRSHRWNWPEGCLLWKSLPPTKWFISKHERRRNKTLRCLMSDPIECNEIFSRQRVTFAPYFHGAGATLRGTRHIQQMFFWAAFCHHRDKLMQIPPH